MRCPNCGAEIPDGSVQCPNCGVRILQNQGIYYPNQNPPYAPQAGKGKLIAIIAVVVVAALIIAGASVIFSSTGNQSNASNGEASGNETNNSVPDISFVSKAIGEHAWKLEIFTNQTINPDNLTYGIKKSDGTFLVRESPFPADQREDANGVVWTDSNGNEKVDTGDSITIANESVDGGDSFIITSGAKGSVVLERYIVPMALAASKVDSHAWNIVILISANSINPADVEYSIKNANGEYIVINQTFPTTSGSNDTYGVIWYDIINGDGKLNSGDIIYIDNPEIESGYTFIVSGVASGSVVLP